MGCSVSSHAGVGIYIPSDEGDTSWDPSSVYVGQSSSKHKRQQQQQQQQQQRSKSKRAEQIKKKRASSSSSSSCAQHHEVPCGSLLAPMACQKNIIESSPERQPFPTRPIVNGITQPILQQQERAQHHHHIASSGWVNNSIIIDDDDDDDRSSATDQNHHHPFSNRQWLALPEHQYDMTAVHPSLPPFLGSMYWTPAAASSNSSPPRRQPPPSTTTTTTTRRSGKHAVPSLITPSSTITATDYYDSPMEEEILSSPPPNSSNNPNSSSLFTRFGIQTPSTPPLPEGWESAPTSVSSENDGGDDDFFGEDQCPPIRDDDELMSPRLSVDISRELLDYSTLEESYILDSKRSHQSPRRLFDKDDEVVIVEMDESSSFEVEQRATTATATTPTSRRRTAGKLQSLLCMAPDLTTVTTSSTEEDLLPSPPLPTPQEPVLARVAVASHSPPRPRPPSSPNVATFYGNWGSRRERHVSTLPNTMSGKPIRLRVTESDLSGGGHSNNTSRCSSGGGGSNSNNNHGIGHTLSSHTNHSTSSPPGDFFSYDPYFSTGKYTITLPNGKPYGNGLVMKMGWQFMILEDSRGCVLAVIKSRYTHTPSTVVYAPKARFGGQVASGHRLTRQMKGGCGGGGGGSGNNNNGRKKSVSVIVDGNNDGMMMEGEALYPWALISKGGRTMGDDCTVHLVNDEVGGTSGTRRGKKPSSSNGLFNSKPSFRGRHGFDRELRTHTVVSRTAAATNNMATTVASPSFDKKSNNGTISMSSSTSLEGDDVPCCVIVRDPTNLDAVDITIAPGIDPLLMICYLASHSKMDVEPIMSGY